MFGWILKNGKSSAKASSKYAITEADAYPDLFGSESSTGVTVSQASAQRVSAVYACVRLLSETVGSLPLNVFASEDKTLQVEEKHPLQRILHSEPNDMMSTFTWLEMVMGHALYTGNHYSYIERKGNFEPSALIPFLPQQVSAFKSQGRVFYRVQTADGQKILPDYSVLHVPGHGFDGLTGYAPITHFAREAIGLSLATQQHGALLFKNGTNLGAVLQTDKTIEVERQKELLRFWNEQYQGVRNGHKTGMLVDGLKIEKLGMTSEESQFLETRKFQIEEIARIFGIPPHMIGSLEKATFSNIEHQNINFVTFSIRPWVKRIEAELNRKLFIDTPYYARFNIDGLMRGDFSSRMEGISKALNMGLFTVNEARNLENLPPVEGGDVLRVPVNTAPITATKKEKE